MPIHRFLAVRSIRPRADRQNVTRALNHLQRAEPQDNRHDATRMPDGLRPEGEFRYVSQDSRCRCRETDRQIQRRHRNSGGLAWPIALDSLAIQAGRPLQPIYDSLGSVAEFPVRELSIVVKLQPAPQLPKVQLPKWSIKLIGIKDGHLEKTQQNLCPRDQTSKDASGRGRGMQLKEAEECHRPAQGDRRAARRSGT